MKEKLEDKCSVKESDFFEIFDDFFCIRKIDQKDIESKLLVSEIYNNYEVKKVEIKDGLTYDFFLDKLLEKFNSYFYDGNRKNIKGEKHKVKGYEWINNYTPKLGLLLDDFKLLDINGIKGVNYLEGDKLIDLNENEEKEIKKILNTFSIEDVLSLEKDKKYILLTKNNKISIQNENNILGYLHGDIGEFILFFLVEGYLKNPLLFSKIRHSKSNSSDKIKGTDGVHLNYDNGKTYFTFLESKLRKTLKNSLDDAIDSQKEFLENYESGTLNNEIHILEANSDTIDKDFGDFFESGFEKYIDPYFLGDLEQDSLPFNLVSGLIYELGNYKKSYIGADALNRIEEVLKGYKKIEGLLKNRKITIFLLPLISNEELIKLFLHKTKT